MDAEYIRKVQKWVQLDNRAIEATTQIKKIQEEFKPVLEERDELEKDIVEYVTQKNMDMLTINTSDGNIKFSKKNNTQSMTLKLLKNLLTEYSNQHPGLNSEDMYNFIVNSLEKKTKLNIKRNILN